LATTNLPAPGQYELVEVPFHGDLLEAARDITTGMIYVVIRRICENLGVAFQSQLTKLRGYHWAGVTMIVMPDQRGHQQGLAVLPLSQVPMWLSHIHPSKLGGEGTERLQKIQKLRGYQLEVVDVLYRHFLEPHFGPQPANHAGASQVTQSSQDPILAQARLIVELRQQQLALEGQVAGVARGQQRIVARVEDAVQKVDDLVAMHKAAIGVLEETPRSDRDAAPLTTRAKINMLVRKWVVACDLNRDFERAWNYLYEQFYYRNHFDAKRRAEHSGLSPLDEVERAGRLEELYALASTLFV
jgi:hypothetical protein